jgi:integrase
MKFLDTRRLDTAFVKAGTPMFSDIIEKLGQTNTLTPTRHRDMVSGLRRVARALGRPPEEVPADPVWLQPRLVKVLPAALDLSQKSWTNAMSDAKSGLVHVGVITRTYNKVNNLAPEWRRLWRAVLDSKNRTLQPALSRFVYFLSQHGVRPQDVGEVHALAYRDGLVANEIGKDPDVAYRAAVNGWNLAGQRMLDWPQQRLTLPDRTKRIAFPLDAFPPSFAADLDAFCERLAASDPLNFDADAEPLSKISIRLYRGKILRFASALVHAGEDQAMFSTLSHLVVPTNAEAGLRWLLGRNNNQTTQDIGKIAALLARVGRDHVCVPAQAQARLDDMARRLKVAPTRGMTGKNRERLRVLGSPATLRKLLNLPEVLHKRVGRNAWTYSDALCSEDAIAIGILLYCPVRRKNVSRIHLDRNLHRPGDGRVFLVFEPDEVKNRQRIEFELPPDLVRMLDHHLARRAPLLCPAGTPWLFPMRSKEGPMDQSQFGDRIKARIAKEIGVTMNVHLFRHLAAKILLDANPGAYETVRQILGHASLSKTLAAYAGFEAGTATRLFSEVIEQARKK